MTVRPDDIANLCAIFAELRTGRIARTELQRYVRTSMPIDSDSPCDVILGMASAYGLIQADGGSYAITDRGRRLSKKQKQTSCRISEPAQKFLLTSVYLNMETCGVDCAKFLLCFQVDTALATFVFHRRVQESYEAVSSAERVAVGNLAEILAVAHEKRRLSEAGLTDLCPLVHRISLVDNSAGYDIVSFRGTGTHPEHRIYIEVKGTKKTQVDFVWSRNERRVAGLHKRRYWLYVYTHVDIQHQTGCGPLRINNPLQALNTDDYIVEPIDVRVFKTRP